MATRLRATGRDPHLEVQEGTKEPEPLLRECWEGGGSVCVLALTALGERHPPG